MRRAGKRRGRPIFGGAFVAAEAAAIVRTITLCSIASFCSIERL
jgi:hypothetical protein